MLRSMNTSHLINIIFALYAASTTKAEQMLTAVKLTEYKDKALKEGLNDDMLADEDALMELLEKVGVAGGFAMKGDDNACVC